MANISITSSSTVLYGGPGGESFGLGPGATYVFGAGGNDVFQGSSSYTTLYSGAISDYAFSTAVDDGGSRVLFVQDLRIGGADGVDRYVGNGALGFGFNPNATAGGQTIDVRSAADLLAALPASPNQLPVAYTDSITLSEDTALRFNAVQNDTDPESDPLRAVGVFNPAGNLGLASLDVEGQITYSAIGKFDSLAAGETALESFYYVVSDGRAGSDEGRVNVTITGVNDAPVARPDQIALSQNQARTFNPLTNDSDPALADTF
jgi:VCBS repeat-containing protein